MVGVMRMIDFFEEKDNFIHVFEVAPALHPFLNSQIDLPLPYFMLNLPFSFGTLFENKINFMQNVKIY